MQRQKKQLLGLGGLALVGVMTATACALPSPEASAVGMASEVPVKVTVEAKGEVPNVSITSPDDQQNVVDRILPITVKYAKATKFNVYIKNDSVAGSNEVQITPTEICTPSYSGAEQTCSLKIDLGDGKPGVDGTKFTIRIEAVNENGNQTFSDSVSVFYRSAYLESFANKYVDNGDPVMSALLSKDVKKVAIQAYRINSDGTRETVGVFKDADGAESPYVMYASTHLTQMVGNKMTFALPLWEYEALAGNYDVYLWAYDGEGDNANLIGRSGYQTASYVIVGPDKPGPDDPKDPNWPPSGPDNPNNPDYPPVGPRPPYNPDDPNNPDNPDDPNKPDDGDNSGTKLPDTGSNLFSELNLSSADYIITGLVAFGLVTGFAIFLIIRRSRR